MYCTWICHLTTLVWKQFVLHSTLSRRYFFFFNDTATPEISPLPLHDPLPILRNVVTEAETLHSRIVEAEDGPWQVVDPSIECPVSFLDLTTDPAPEQAAQAWMDADVRSEEHTSELQSQSNIVCRLLLEKKTKCRRTDTFRSASPTRSRAIPQWTSTSNWRERHWPPGSFSRRRASLLPARR